MHANNLIINDGATGQAVECVAELLPHFDGEATAALVVETVDSIDSGALVVAAQEEKVLRVFDLVGEEEADDFEGLLAAIDIVTEKEIVGLEKERESKGAWS